MTNSSSSVIKAAEYRDDAVVVTGRRCRAFTPTSVPGSGETRTEQGSAGVDRCAPLETARLQARRVVAEAEARAGLLAREAWERGYAEGRAQGLKAIEEQCSSDMQRLAELAKRAVVDRDAMIRSAERDMATLAVAIAEKVLHHEIATDPAVILRMVQAALSKVAPGDSVRLLVHPEDVPLVRERFPELEGASALGPKWEVVGDGRMQQGDCVIETKGGTVDSRIRTQLAEIAAAFGLGPWAQ